MNLWSQVILIFTVGLALSVGWGIRGNFGHETGAMIPGALASMAAVILTRRSDWPQRIGSFAFFGSLGWSFGGSISYMQVIAYTHSGHWPSVIYGFASLFLIGFLWAFFGGIGTALPGLVPARQLYALYPLVVVIFAAWCLQDYLVARFVDVDPAFRQRDPLYWYDTDWLGVTVALVSVILYSGFRRRFDFGCRMISAMCLGWWGGFLLLVVILGWRMTPPRGDNWAGCLGMVVGLGIFLFRQKLYLLLGGGILAGVVGGVGFALADCLKLLGIASGLITNWHSVLEQSYGLINGFGIAAMVLFLLRRLPQEGDVDETMVNRNWEGFAIVFVLVGITYINFRKNVLTWVRAGSVPNEIYGYSASAWFFLAYVLVGLLLVSVIFVRKNHALELFRMSWVGRAQGIFLFFLWSVVVGNFERALVRFEEQRMITEGLIFLNAIFLTAIILHARPVPPASKDKPRQLVWQRWVATCGAVFIATTLICWGAVYLVHGSAQIGFAKRQMRFGPDATATTEKLNADKPHP